MDKQTELFQLYSRLLSERTSHILLERQYGSEYFSFTISFESNPNTISCIKEKTGIQGLLDKPETVSLLVTYNPDIGIALDSLIGDKAVSIIGSCLRTIMLDLASFPDYDEPYDINTASDAYYVLGKLTKLAYYTELAASAEIPERYKHMPNSRALVRNYMVWIY